MKIIDNPRLVMSEDEKKFLIALAQDLESYCFKTGCDDSRCQIKGACDKVQSNSGLEGLLRTLVALIPVDDNGEEVS